MAGLGWMERKEIRVKKRKRPGCYAAALGTSPPGHCRSASRFHSQPDDASDLVGFRVVCLPQGPSLNS
jgi:formylglycine-generating enzyme required for sulfatase activity